MKNICPQCHAEVFDYCPACGYFFDLKGKWVVESEYRKGRLLDTVARWAHHTKAEQMLRNGDMENLVSRILGEFYHVTLCCGHQVNTIPHIDEEVVIEFEDCDGMVQGSYCRPCAEEYKKNLNAKEINISEPLKGDE